jgi:hypothetical protein
MRRWILLLMFWCIHTVLLLFLFHTRVFDHLVYFYRGLVYIFFISLCLGFVSWACWKKHLFGSMHISVIASSVAVFFSFHIVFFTLVPVTLDRSISTYLLQRMARDSETSFTTQELSHILVTDYFQQNHVLDKRLNEQIQTGTIASKSGLYSITPRGGRVVWMYAVIARFFGL